MKTARIFFWILLAITLVMIPIAARPIEYGHLIVLPLGAGVVIAGLIAFLLNLHGRGVGGLLLIMLISLALVQIVFLFVISLTKKRRTFILSLTVILILLLLDIAGCQQVLRGLNHLGWHTPAVIPGRFWQEEECASFAIETGLESTMPKIARMQN